MGQANHPVPSKSGRMASQARRWSAARTEGDVRSVTSGKAVLTAHREPASLHRLGRDADRAPLGGNPSRDLRLPGENPNPVLDGWDAHAGVSGLLGPRLVPA